MRNSNASLTAGCAAADARTVSATNSSSLALANRTSTGGVGIRGRRRRGPYGCGLGRVGRPGAGASVVVPASVDVAAGRVLRVGGALSSSRGRRARRRLAEDDEPVAGAVEIAAKGLPAQGADPLDERR